MIIAKAAYLTATGIILASTYATSPPPIAFQEGAFEAEVHRPDGYTAWYHGKSAPLSCIALAKPSDDELPEWHVSCIDGMTTAPVSDFTLSCANPRARIFIWDGVRFEFLCRPDLLVGSDI